MSKTCSLLRTVEFLVFGNGFFLIFLFSFSSLFVHFEKLCFEQINIFRVVSNLLVDVPNWLIQHVELLPVDVWCHLSILFSLILHQFLPGTFSSILTFKFLFLKSTFTTFSFSFLFCNQVFDDNFKWRFVPSLLHLQPNCHDWVLKLDGQRSSMFLISIVVNLAIVLVASKKLGVTIWVADYIVKSWFFSIWIKKNSLLVLKCLIKFNVFLSEFVNDTNVKVKYRDSCFALGISINTIIHQERVMVDNATSVKLFNDKFILSFIHSMDYFNQTTLDDVHLFRISVNFIQKRVDFQCPWSHVEDPIILNMLGESLKEVDSVETKLQENLERVIVLHYVSLYHLVDVWIKLKDLIVIRSVKLGASAIVSWNDIGRSFALEKHTDLTKMILGVQYSNNLLFISINDLVLNCDHAFTFCNKVDVIIVVLRLFFLLLFSFQLFILFAKNLLWSLQDCFHSFHDVRQHFIVITLWLFRASEQLGCDRIVHDGFFENLNWTQDPVSLGNSFLHEVIKFFLEFTCRVSCNEVLRYLSS